ncbi:MAG: glycosyltransferase family 2 protein [Candidatus Woesearchaeota archaeon]
MEKQHQEKPAKQKTTETNVAKSPQQNVVVIIPAYNEQKTIATAVSNALPYADAIVVVNDGSVDATLSKVLALRRQSSECKKKLHVLSHVINLGKGATLTTGIEYARASLAPDYLVLMDADLQHQATDIPKFLKALKNADIVFGYRTYSKTMPLVFRLGNKGLNFFVWLLYGISIPDTQCGFRAMKASVYPKIQWQSTKYSVESEMIAKTAKAGLSYALVPIPTIYHEAYKGTTVIDGIKILFNMLLWKIK